MALFAGVDATGEPARGGNGIPGAGAVPDGLRPARQGRMAEGETGIRCDRLLECVDKPDLPRQQTVEPGDIVIPRRRGARAEPVVVAVFQGCSLLRAALPCQPGVA
ncbi:hypothetical protein [Dinoroseobacter sp. S124A]|uniref:hypothetical protein n=1 Tax=Dinoroseobacter sp. S124A TaxID=3415128 RepID=UPI003C7DEAD6